VAGNRGEDGTAIGEAVALAAERLRDATERGGTANLARIGLDDWSVTSTDAYVARAIRAAGDLAALAEIRAGLRGRIADSPLRQASNVARSLEFAFRVMWQRWCMGQPAVAFAVTLEQALQRP
jgi:hypothetical protein